MTRPTHHTWIVQKIYEFIEGMDHEQCLAIAGFAIAEATMSHNDEEARQRIGEEISEIAYNLDELIEHRREQEGKPSRYWGQS
jgi:nickel-dependent lactate racemase